MIYTRLEYAVLLLITWLVYLLWRGRSGRLHLLILASLFFYGWAGAFDLSIFLTVIVFAYIMTVLSEKFPHLKGTFIASGIIVLVLHLLFWKYLPWAGRGAGVEIWLPLPLGISFFTLQGIGYLVDYKRGKSERMGFSQFLLFKSFFPQLIAGPIVRAADMWPFLKTLPTPNLNQVTEGLYLIGIGLVKKLIIADYLGVFVDGIFSNPQDLDRATLMLGAVAFYVQIWGDFSGYTDIGRGSALLFGLRLPENFYSTLFANGGTDWARRWHATLQTWVRDYIYFPMVEWLSRFKPSFVGQERFQLAVQVFSRYTSAMIVALWHGAAMNFFIWGLMLWVIATVEEIFKKLGLIAKNPSVKRRIFDILAMMPVFFLTGVFFRCPSLETLGAYLSGLFGANPNTVSFTEYADPVYWRLALAFAIDGVMYYSLKNKRYVFLSRLAGPAQTLAHRFPMLTYAMAGAMAATLIILAIAFRASDSLTGFIYFRF